MMLTAARMRQIGWGALLAFCILAFTVMSLSVHAVQNEVVLAERRIIALKQETLLLETEFESRANQRQLAHWNRVEFGYLSPRADQYIDSRQDLAALGEPLGPDAPRPVRLARADLAALDPALADHGEHSMVSPISGAPIRPTVGAGGSMGEFSDAFEEFVLDLGPRGEAGSGAAARVREARLAAGGLTGNAPE